MAAEKTPRGQGGAHRTRRNSAVQARLNGSRLSDYKEWEIFIDALRICVLTQRPQEVN